ncbi:MAG: hypothetical protein P4L54_08980 [Acidocella sp.]|nr:hypothetical protein [Acidocella sp.]
MSLTLPRKLLLAVAGLAAAGALALPQPAQARVFFRFGIGVPVYFGPHYYRPYYPYYYAPGPVYYAPPAPLGYSCNADGYVCPLRYAKPVDTGCVCPTYGGGPVGGYVQ